MRHISFLTGESLLLCCLSFLIEESAIFASWAVSATIWMLRREEGRNGGREERRKGETEERGRRRKGRGREEWKQEGGEKEVRERGRERLKEGRGWINVSCSPGLSKPPSTDHLNF